jgi:hypothetical protein
LDTTEEETLDDEEAGEGVVAEGGADEADVRDEGRMLAGTSRRRRMRKQDEPDESE